MSPHRILIGCATVGALALAPCTPALATGHTSHGKGHGQASTHGQRHGTGHDRGQASNHGKGHSRDRLTGPRGAAEHVLHAQAARLARILAAVGAGDTLNAGDQAALLAALHADLDALTGDVAAIPDATSVQQINAVKHAALLTVTIAGRQVSVTVEADAVEAQAAERAATLTGLSVQVAIAVDTGHPVAGAEAAIEDAQSRLTVATTDAQNAVSAILALSPTASRSDLQGASDAATQALLDAENALATVDADIATANAALGN